MILWIKETLKRQIVFLIVGLVLAILAHYYLSIRIPLRVSMGNVGKAVLIGSVIAFAMISLLLLLGIKKSHLVRPSYLKLQKLIEHLSIPTLIGWILVSGAIEELVFRAMTIRLTLGYGLWVTIPVVTLIGFLLNFKGRDYTAYAILKAVQAMLLGIIFITHRSYFVIFVARVMIESFELFFLKFRAVARFRNELPKGE